MRPRQERGASEDERRGAAGLSFSLVPRLGLGVRRSLLRSFLRSFLRLFLRSFLTSRRRRARSDGSWVRGGGGKERRGRLRPRRWSRGRGQGEGACLQRPARRVTSRHAGVPRPPPDPSIPPGAPSRGSSGRRPSTRTACVVTGARRSPATWIPESRHRLSGTHRSIAPRSRSALGGDDAGRRPPVALEGHTGIGGPSRIGGETSTTAASVSMRKIS